MATTVVRPVKGNNERAAATERVLDEAMFYALFDTWNAQNPEFQQDPIKHFNENYEKLTILTSVLFRQ